MKVYSEAEIEFKDLVIPNFKLGDKQYRIHLSHHKEGELSIQISEEIIQKDHYGYNEKYTLTLREGEMEVAESNINKLEENLKKDIFSLK